MIIKGVFILFRNRERQCAAASEYFCFSKRVGVSRNISKFLKNVRLLLKDINERLLLKSIKRKNVLF